jgi:hypothetical protein
MKTSQLDGTQHWDNSLGNTVCITVFVAFKKTLDQVYITVKNK